MLYDIETKTFGKPDGTKDEYKVLGYHDVEKNETGIIFGDIEKVIELFKKHKIIIGFNNYYYDNEVLHRAGLNFKYHIVIDLYKIIKDKSDIMGIDLTSYSLSSIAKHLKISLKDEKFDYTILNKDTWTKEEEGIIRKYTLQDIKVTLDLWNYVVNFFEPFKDYIEPSAAKKYKHITLSIGAYVYKVICKEANIEERYGNIKEHEFYKGGFVAEPSDELIVGNIYCLDFNSMYPHAYIQANLFSYNCKCCQEHEKFTGNDLFKLQGAYCSRKNGKIENVIKKLYNLRQQFKQQGDAREYTIKIIINTMYGVCGNPGFLNLYNINTAADCTHIARTCIKLARKKFKQAGYRIIYSDTDSVYIEDLHNNEKVLLAVKDSIVNEIKDALPFPRDTFDMGIDDRIKLMFFPGLKKKNYIYVTTNNKIKIKGLPFKKSNASLLAMIVFNKYIKNEIINNNKVKFKATQIKDWMYEELGQDVSLAAINFKVMDKDVYKNASQIQSQISQKYGPGNHKLIPNIFHIGAGKGKGYCTVKEFKDNKLKVSAIDLSKTYSELNIFSEIDLAEMYVVKTKNKIINTLTRWL